MWYGIRTEPGREEAVRRLIGRSMSPAGSDDCRILYCIRKKRYRGAWHEERERFLPGYLFLVTEEMRPETEESDVMPEGRGISTEQPAFKEAARCIDGIFPVGYEEEQFLVRLTGGKEEIGMSYGVIRNGTLEIRSGGLVGMESRVRKIDRHKRKGAVTMKLHGVETTAELGLEITEKTGSPPKPSRREGLCLSGDDP